MSKIAVLQHTPAEGLGRLAPLLDEAGLRVAFVAHDAPLPRDLLDDTRGLIVLGGPMGVYESDAHPRLLDEQRLIERALDARLPTLGICLGSQLLAAVLGAEVEPGPQKELGWLDVTLEPAASSDPLFSSLPSTFTALHWHGDVFDLPRGARPLARSALTRHQAFSYGEHAWGLLFHLEADLPQIEAMTRAFDDEVRSVGETPASILDASRAHDASAASLARALFGRWMERIAR